MYDHKISSPFVTIGTGETAITQFRIDGTSMKSAVGDGRAARSGLARIGRPVFRTQPDPD